MEIKILVENATYRKGILAEHGLSVYIEAAGKKILFDAGQTGALMQNAAAMGVDLAEVELAVLSHGHYDHSGGFPAFAALNKNAPIYLRKEALGEFHSMKRDGSPGGYVGISWSPEERSALASRLEFAEGVASLGEGLFLFNVPGGAEAGGSTESFLEREAGGGFRTDPLLHEQFLAIEEDGQLFLFSGCSHTGAAPMLRRAGELFPGKKIRFLLAGLHLVRSSRQEAEQMAALLAAMELTVAPLHCTGMEAACLLKERLGERCLLLHAGDVLSF
ncbi:MAG: MBL fold metallo-hydrolase [Bacillota bacterium]|nr:MBL fold metallo-hydrolase [Bacillota bacterium]